MLRPALPLAALFATCLAFGFARAESPADAPEPAEFDGSAFEEDAEWGPWATAEPSAPSFREPFFPFLEDEDASLSVSVGDTSHGYVVNAKELVETDAVGILPRQKERHLEWGTAEMIGLIEHAARALHDATKTRLWIGDIGRRGGGDIIYSVSHNSGRDVDIALSYLDKTNARVDAPDLVHLDFRGESIDKALRFDVERTWIVVRALLEYPGADIQFIFLSLPLKRKLLEYANTHHEPRAIIDRATEVIGQPGSPHDDHLHVRITCSSRDRGGGCVDRGRVTTWARPSDAPRTERIEAAKKRLDAPRAELRRAAVKRLEVLAAAEHVDAIGGLLGDADASVRAAAAGAVATLGSQGYGDAVVRAYVAESDASTKVAMLGALQKLGGAPAGHLFASVIGATPPLFCDELVDRPEPLLSGESLLATPGLPKMLLLSVACADRAARTAVLAAAVEGAGYADRTEPVEPLLALLETEDVDTREKAADALARITNIRFGQAWNDASLAPSARDKDVRNWRKWAEQLKKTPREFWVASGFVASGYRIPRLDTDHAWELVRALPRRDHLAYNAHRILERTSGRKEVHLKWSDGGTCKDWLDFFVTNRVRFKLDEPRKPLIEACRAARR